VNISNSFYYFVGLDAEEEPSIPWGKRKTSCQWLYAPCEPGRNLKSTDMVTGKLSRSVSGNSQRLVHRVAVAAVRCAPHDAGALKPGLIRLSRVCLSFLDFQYNMLLLTDTRAFPSSPRSPRHLCRFVAQISAADLHDLIGLWHSEADHLFPQVAPRC
jgi:hypothetical protein